MKKDNRFWMWGYYLDEIPGNANFVPGATSCSIETAAEYMGCTNLCWLNSLHGVECLKEETFEKLQNFDTIFCGLAHIEQAGPGKGDWKLLYKETAARIAELSLKFPNIKGAIFDDFRSPDGPSADFTDEELHVVNATLKDVNPDLKLHLVHYLVRQDATKLESCRDDFDGLSIWDWRSSDYFWNSLYEDLIFQIHRLYSDKEIIQGQFIHAYGDANNAQPMDQMMLQCDKISRELDRNRIQGWCALQSGWFCRHDHREQVEYLKNYWNWFRDTRTRR